MKKIIIAGICLVTAAIVYGFTDYLSTDKKQLQRMYSDEPAAGGALPVQPAAMPAEKAPVIPEVLLPKAVPASTPEPLITRRRHKKLNLKQYSRAEMEEKYILPDSAKLAPAMAKATAARAALVAPAIPVVAAPAVAPAKKSFVRSKKQKDEEIIFEKIEPGLFSRAPLKRRKPVVVADTTLAVRQ